MDSGLVDLGKFENLSARIFVQKHLTYFSITSIFKDDNLSGEIRKQTSH